MSYEIKRLAPNLVCVEMWGYIDKKIADAYYPEAWQELDQGEPKTNFIIVTKRVDGFCPGARCTIDKIGKHPNVGTFVFVVSQSYLLLFSPIVQLFSGVRLFGSEEEALSFLGFEIVPASQV